MQRVAKLVILIVLGCVLFAGLALLVVNIYVQKAHTQARIEDKLSKALGLPLKLRHVSFTPWGGLSLCDVHTPQDPSMAAPGRSDFMQAQGIHSHVEFLPLLKRHVVLERLTIEEPRITWRQDGQGKWRLPNGLPDLPPATIASGAVAPQAPEPVSPTLPSEPLIESPVSPAPFDFLLKQIVMRSGSFGFFTSSWEPIAEFGGVDLEVPAFDPLDLRGLVSSSSATFRGALFLQNVRAPFHYRPDELRLEQLEADLAGGRVCAKLLLRPDEAKVPFSAELKLEHADANRLVEEACGSADRISGSLSGDIALTGLMADTESINGRGRMVLSEGRINNAKFLAALGKAMRIEELVDPVFQQAVVDFRVAEQRIYLEDLVLHSANLTVRANGFINFERQLELKVLLTVNERISRHLPKFVLANFEPGSAPDLMSVSFDVGGTLEKPRSNLLERIIGQKVENEVQNLFQRLFLSPKKKSIP